MPGEILDEERAFARFAGGCVICTTIEAELAAGERVVFADDDVVCVAPFWSGAPFELLLMPRRHEAHLQDADPASLDAMGRGIRDAVAHLNAALGDVAYNLGFHTAPHEHSGQYHWHVHLWPNLVTAGRLRARHRRDDQRHAARDGRRDAARRPHPGVTRIRVAADYDATARPPSGAAVEHVETHVDWMADAEAIRFLTEQTAGRRHPFECVTEDRAGPPDRPDGDHRVGARPGDGRAPHRRRHRHRAVHARRRSTAAGAPASRGTRS